jgi:hypothetical protein
MVKRTYQSGLVKRDTMIGFPFHDASERFGQRLIFQDNSAGHEEIAFRRLIVSKPKKNPVFRVTDNQIDRHQWSQPDHRIQVGMAQEFGWHGDRVLIGGTPLVIECSFDSSRKYWGLIASPRVWHERIPRGFYRQQGHIVSQTSLWCANEAEAIEQAKQLVGG